MRIARVLLGVVVPLTTACVPSLSMGSAGPNRVLVSNPSQRDVVLRGQVRLPKSFAVQHTTADILGNATVSLLDAGGVVRMAGTTDAAGSFSLYRPTTAFTLVDGAMYQLEILKRLTATTTDKPVLSLKTYMKRVGGGWESIAMQGSTVVVNLHTTALSYFVDDGSATAAQVIGGLTGANLDTLAPAITAIPGATAGIDRRVTSMTSLLLIGKDPVGTRNFTRDSGLNLTDATTVAEASYVTQVNGSLVIESNTLTTLSLPLLTTVTDRLQIRNCPNLTSVNLPALTTASSGIELENCPLMTQLPSMPALTDLGNAGLSLQNMAGLTSLAGAGNLQNMNRLSLSNCSALTDLTGLTALRSAGLSLRDNAALTSLNGLSALRTCSELSLANSPNLVSVAALAGVTGDMQITISNCGLPDLTGLSGVTSANNGINLSNLPQLTSLNGLGGLTTVQAMQLMNCPQLTSMAGLGALTTIQNSLSISSSAAFASFAGMGALTSIGSLQLSNSAVSSLLPLHALTSLGFKTFNHNANLTQGCINALQAAFPAQGVSGFGNNASLTCP